MQKVLVIVGPTAIGKTALGIKLAKSLNGEIISGDSMQIYREVEIGTAKPTPSEMAVVPHHLINERSIFEPYSVKDFVAAADQEIVAITARENIPIIVGGTGFYLNAVLNDFQLGESGEYDSPTEKIWEEYLEVHGPEKLWAELFTQDKVAAQNIPYQNSRRVLRALSVITRTKKKFSEQQTVIKPRYDAKIIGLNTERELLYQRINLRVDQMMDQGLLNEAEFVYHNKDRMFQAIQAIGYKEFLPYFAGEIDLETAVGKLKQASRKYAKRQITYFKNKFAVTWFDPLKDSDVKQKIIQEVGEWLND